ncbi:MAG TPA: fumarylacetoacetate hydrolase family protein [Thermomicrobiales bacterium]|nr:fumarylacetoacetate hydrolase family protein [Thermomicrobiales bacterium]
MKIVRYSASDSADARYGIVEGSTVYAAAGDLFDGLAKGEEVGSLDDLTLLAPLKPGKVIAIGLNYVDHVTENDPTRTIPTTPVVFMKPTSAIVGPGQPIELAYPENNIDYEAELVVVIGKTARDVSETDALDYVFGYTAGNDVSDRVQQFGDGQWIRGKGYDTYLPLGPAIETDLDVSDTKVESRLNGEVRQSESTKSLIFSVPFLISFLSQVMTLEPGDIIMTGTPHGVGPMKEGDVIEIEVGGVGVLKNPVVNRKKAS